MIENLLSGIPADYFPRIQIRYKNNSLYKHKFVLIAGDIWKISEIFFQSEE
jgi:hypothetical protein